MEHDRFGQYRRQITRFNIDTRLVMDTIEVVVKRLVAIHNDLGVMPGVR